MYTRVCIRVYTFYCCFVWGKADCAKKLNVQPLQSKNSNNADVDIYVYIHLYILFRGYLGI